MDFFCGGERTIRLELRPQSGTPPSHRVALHPTGESLYMLTEGAQEGWAVDRFDVPMEVLSDESACDL